MAVFDEAVVVNGLFQARGAVSLPSNSIGNEQFQVANPLEVEKQEHQYQFGWSQAHGTDSTAERRSVYRARGAGELIEFKAWATVAATGDDTVTVDLRKNGTSILDAVITLDVGDAAYAKVAAVIDTAAYAAGDVFEIVITPTHNTGTLPQGVACNAFVREAQ